MSNIVATYSREQLEVRLNDVQKERPGLADRVAKLAAWRTGLLSEERRLEENLARIRDNIQQADGQYHGAEHLLSANNNEEATIREEIEYRDLGDRRVGDLTAAELDRYLDLREKRQPREDL